MNEQDFQNITDAAVHLMTAPFILFIVGAVIAAMAVVAVVERARR